MYPRLKEFRESLGLTQTEFGQSIGIAKSTYNNYEIGIRDPKSDFWIAIAQKYGVTIDYLMGYSNSRYQTKDNFQKAPSYSEEAMNLAYDYDNRIDDWGRRHLRNAADFEIERYESEQNRVKKKGEWYISKKSISQPEENVISLRLSVQPASAGTGTYLGPEEFETIFVKENNLTRRAAFAVPVSGNSMEPKFHDRDILLVEKSEAIDVGEIGIFTIDGEGYVKKLGNGELISLNSEYDPIGFNDTIRCNGRVIGILDPEWIAE